MYTPNKFFLKLEAGAAHGGAKILAMTHLPRVFTPADALTLAADLTLHAGGPAALEPYLVSAYGGRGPFELACKTGFEAKAAAEKQTTLAQAAQAKAAQTKEDADNLAEAKLMASAGAPLIPEAKLAASIGEAKKADDAKFADAANKAPAKA